MSDAARPPVVHLDEDMAAFDRVVVIFNPKSTGDAPDAAADLVAEVRDRQQDVQVESWPTEYAGHARELARRAATETARPLVVSVSGDGGFNEVVDGLASSGNSDVGAAVLAAGNANDHRRVTRRHPLGEAIVAALAGGEVEHLDVLRMTEGSGEGARVRHAHSYIGLGLTPVVASDIEHGGKGSLREIVTTVKTFWKYRPFTIRGEDGGDLEFDSLVFANIPEMAKYAKLSQGRPDDGHFEVVTIPHRTKVRTVAAGIRAAVRGLGAQPSTDRYAFTTIKPLPVQLDGEVDSIDASRDVVVDLLPGGLRTVE